MDKENRHKELLERITIKPGLMSGKPTIRGLRFPVGDILEMLANGMSLEAILEQHPVLERDDINAALLYLSTNFQSHRTIY